MGTISSLRQQILNTKLKISQDSTVLGEYDAKLAELKSRAESMPEKILPGKSILRVNWVWRSIKVKSMRWRTPNRSEAC